MFNAFANFGDIKGESTDKDHKDWVMILKYDHALTQPPSVSQKTAGGRAAEEVNHSEFTVVKLLDAATPKLYEAACKGTHLPEQMDCQLRVAGRYGVPGSQGKVSAARRAH